MKTHKQLEAMYEQDKIDYPEFYKKLWQLWHDNNWITVDGELSFSTFEEYRRHPHYKKNH